MKTSFSKYQGTGNDFILIEDLKGKISLSSEDVAKLCHRHFGVGADGVIAVRASRKGDFFMLFYNPDGTQAEMCGNGIRCFAKYLYDRELSSKLDILVDTLAGVKEVSLILDNKAFRGAKVNMGRPVFASGDIPVLLSENEVIGKTVGIGKGKVSVTCVSMGNPHTVIFVEDVYDAPVETLGPAIEHLDLFPNRTNVEFAQVMSPTEISLRVWERGAGETLACGTGACAAVAAAFRNGLSERRAIVHLRGGDLEINWLEGDGIYLTGPAEEVFKGEVSI